jgi:hypothetical protein
MLANGGILQGNPPRRVVHIGRVTAVAAAAVDAPDLAEAGATGPAAGARTSSACAWALSMRLTARRGRVGYVR